jgi:hypothetical protein
MSGEHWARAAGSRAEAGASGVRSAALFAGHARLPWDESPLCNLMEVKREGGTVRGRLREEWSAIAFRGKENEYEAVVIRQSGQPTVFSARSWRLAPTMCQYTLQDSDAEQLNNWAPFLVAKVKELPMLHDIANDQQIAGTMATLTVLCRGGSPELLARFRTQ